MNKKQTSAPTMHTVAGGIALQGATPWKRDTSHGEGAWLIIVSYHSFIAYSVLRE